MFFRRGERKLDLNLLNLNEYVSRQSYLLAGGSGKKREKTMRIIYIFMYLSTGDLLLGKRINKGCKCMIPCKCLVCSEVGRPAHTITRIDVAEGI